MLYAAFGRMHQRALRAERRVRALQREVADWEASFKLYDKAMRAAIKPWQRATGRYDVLPDATALCRWLLNERRALLRAMKKGEPP